MRPPDGITALERETCRAPSLPRHVRTQRRPGHRVPRPRPQSVGSKCLLFPGHPAVLLGETGVTPLLRASLQGPLDHSPEG